MRANLHHCASTCPAGERESCQQNRRNCFHINFDHIADCREPWLECRNQAFLMQGISANVPSNRSHRCVSECCHANHCDRFFFVSPLAGTVQEPQSATRGNERLRRSRTHPALRRLSAIIPNISRGGSLPIATKAGTISGRAKGPRKREFLSSQTVLKALIQWGREKQSQLSTVPDLA